MIETSLTSKTRRLKTSFIPVFITLQTYCRLSLLFTHHLPHFYERMQVMSEYWGCHVTNRYTESSMEPVGGFGWFSWAEGGFSERTT